MKTRGQSGGINSSADGQQMTYATNAFQRVPLDTAF